ncbi:hypothetical protein CCACVL1_23629 [Corchorus capsularis]|uniref:Uncharacterized protein n=1 Tax=Corchorus capsularis TaxID=210143 RepID=A0A1R3GT27_COCAP|nr:hypothetical protein CCACVL1_23629 [Corchorus capsularis]
MTRSPKISRFDRLRPAASHSSLSEELLF